MFMLRYLEPRAPESDPMSHAVETTVRIAEPSLDNTKKLLGEVLVPMIRDDKRVLFLCPAGEGEAILQRLRVMISRERGQMRANKRKPKQFRFRATIHPETHNGIRYDACVCWKQVSDSTMMLEILEDIGL